MRAGAIVAKRTRDTLTASRLRPRAATATALRTRWLRPDSSASMRAASAASSGLPRMRDPMATVVSAQRIGADASPRAQAPACGAQLGARHTLDIGLGRFADARRFERFDVLAGG